MSLFYNWNGGEKNHMYMMLPFLSFLRISLDSDECMFSSPEHWTVLRELNTAPPINVKFPQDQTG